MIEERHPVMRVEKERGGISGQTRRSGACTPFPGWKWLAALWPTWHGESALMWRNAQGRLNGFVRMAAAVLVCHFVIGLVLAASPSLHHFLHHDSQANGHVCFATNLAAGNCEGPPSAAGLLVPAARVCRDEPVLTTDWVASVFQTGAVFEHAPPALLS